MRKGELLYAGLGAAAVGSLLAVAGELDAQQEETDHRIIVGLATNSATITTPWHANELNNPDFWGLDLVMTTGPTEGTKVFYQSHHDYSGGQRGMWAWVYDHTRSGTTCTGADIEFYDAVDGRFLGEEHYVHVKNAAGLVDSYFYVAPNGSWTVRELGIAGYAQPPGCPFGGPHLHQSGQDGLPTFYRNEELDDGYPSNPVIYPTSDYNNNWMHKATWS